MRAEDEERHTSQAAGRDIVTARLILRQPAPADLPVLNALSADKAIAGNLCVAIALNGGNTFVVTTRADGGVIGCVGYGATRDMPTATEVGVWIGVSWWGRGYATEAVQALIDRAFGEGQAKALWCSNRVTNTPARRVIEKCGFQFRGTGMVRSPTTFGAFPIERFVLDRRNWASIKAWGAQPLPTKEPRRETAA